ncbi:MAG: TolC family protein [Desulfobacteraceae bacterium]|nr:MAG: TolC family protein [Desulfobacteraceae bacterium]
MQLLFLLMIEQTMNGKKRMMYSDRVCRLMCFIPAVMIMAILTSGCVLLHPTDPYATASRLNVTSMDNPADLQDERTPQADLQAPLTLAEAIRIALANNPEINAAQWDVAAAGSRLDAARAGRYPILSAEGRYQHSLDDQRMIAARYDGEPGIFDQDIYRGDLILRLPLFTGGRLTNEIRAAELLSQSEEKRLSYTREELVFNVSSTFYAMLSQEEVIRSLEFSINAMQEHRKQVSDLLALQKAARVDLLRSEVRLADLRQSMVRERNVLAIEKRYLANLLGIEDNGDQLSVNGLLTFEEPVMENTGDLVAVALKRRNDYLAAQTRLEAQARRVDAVRAGHWPAVSALGSYGVTATGSSEREDVGTIGLGVSMPLFEGGRIEAQIRQERAVLAASQERLRKLALQIRREVETALLDIQSGSERIQATRQSIEQAKESLRIERMKYDLGSGSITDVLDAQSALLQSETNYARALADFHIANARLAFATGENSL